MSTATLAAPPASERDDVLELRLAMEEYKRTSHRMFPTWCEVLEVLHGLGYEKAVGVESGRRQ